MKISKQEQIIIIVLLVAAIVGVGLFVFLLPNIDKIGENNKKLEAKQTEYQGYLTELEHEKTIDDEIKAAYEEGKDLADTFYNDLTTYEADEIIRQFLANDTDIVIDGLEISPLATESLIVSVFNETEVTYPLKDFANTVVVTEEEAIDFNTLSDREKIMYAKDFIATNLSQSQPVVVGVVNVSFTAHCEKLENLHAFVDRLYTGVRADGEKAKATYLAGVSYELYEKTQTVGVEDETSTPADNTSAPADNTTNNTESDTNADDGYSMDFAVKFYCIQPVADPFANGTAA